jgi:lipoprotein-releasing system permease protein
VNILFAWRYFKAKKTTHAINIISWISVVAMAVGTAALIVLLSVFNGFESLVKSLYADFYTDIRITTLYQKSFSLNPQQQQQLNHWPGIKKAALTLEEKALLQNGEYQQLVILKGVDSNYVQVNGIGKNITKGQFLLGNTNKPLAVLGVGVENAIGVETEKAILPLAIYLPQKEGSTGAADPLQSLSVDNIFTAGSFAIQQDFDNNYVITNIDFVQRMLHLTAPKYTAIEIALHNPQDAATLKAALQKWLGKTYIVETRYEQNKSLYSTMQMEKWFIYILLSFILVIAAFTMIGALTMLVLEKQRDINILKALGSSNLLIQKIFLSEGLLLALLGGGIGVLLAFIIGWAQIKWALVKIQGNTFLIDRYPVQFMATDIVLVLSTVLVIALLAAWLPSRKAAKQPLLLR